MRERALLGFDGDGDSEGEGVLLWGVFDGSSCIRLLLLGLKPLDMVNRLTDPAVVSPILSLRDP